MGERLWILLPHPYGVRHLHHDRTTPRLWLYKETLGRYVFFMLPIAIAMPFISKVDLNIFDLYSSNRFLS